MKFRILGVVAVGVDGTFHAVPGLRQRCLLASLLIQAPAVVPVSTLYAELWGRTHAATVENALQAHVSRLRRTLVRMAGDPAAADMLRTRGSAYSLDVEPEDVDLHRFRDFLGRSRRAMAEGEMGSAAELLDKGLQLWQDPSLRDAAIGPLCRSAAMEWEEEYLSAQEDALWLRLLAGEPVRVVGELKRMSAAYPWRERSIELLMLALYRSGRQAEAVGVYNDARSRLVDELGMEPSPHLRGLFRKILNQDPGLHGAATSLSRTA